jgi:UDP-N-acetylglucosamine 2-epimerase (non-hydrolysing)
MKKSIALIVGTRPNFMKAAPLYEAFVADGKYYVYIVHTGQHYDYNMSDIFFEQLGLTTAPVTSLNVGSATQNTQTANIMLRLEQEFNSNRPDLVVVFGDVTSTLAAGLTCNKMGIKVAHVESGNRSFDKTMPEEINRIITDNVCDYHFIAEPYAIENLRNERIIKNDVLTAQHAFYVGNTMIDTLYKLKPTAEKLDVWRQYNLQPGQYVLTTLHRPSNVDDEQHLRIIIDAFKEISKVRKILFPVHPRKRERITKLIGDSTGIILCEPLGYLEFMNLHINCGLLMTDSGGLQEEATVLGKPCITLRPNTERYITCTHGTNYLMKDLDTDLIIRYVNMAFDGISFNKQQKMIPLWDGHASERIVQIIGTILN